MNVPRSSFIVHRSDQRTSLANARESRFAPRSRTSRCDPGSPRRAAHGEVVFGRADAQAADAHPVDRGEKHTSEHAVNVDTLPPLHRDPFGRLLIARAL